MNVVIATGCPGSGWETVIPVLNRAGLVQVGRAGLDGLDDLLGRLSQSDPLTDLEPFFQASEAARELAEVLVQANPDSPVLIVDDRSLALLDAWARTIPQARFLLFYGRAELALARGLSEGGDPRAVLEEWSAVSRQMLQFQRRNRARAILLDAEDAIRHPGECVETLRGRGLVLQEVQDLPQPDADPFVIERLLAREMMPERMGLDLLQAELEASSLPLIGQLKGPKLDKEAILEGYRGLRSRERTLRQRLDAVEADAAARKSALVAANQEIAQLSEQLNQAQQELRIKEAQVKLDLEAAEAVRQELAQENELLIFQLTQLQEEVEHYSTGYHESLSRIQSKDQQVADVSRQLTAIHQSVSWKAIAPLRVLAGRRDRADAAAKARLKRHVSLIARSGLFDKQWYLARYEDVRRSGIDPVRHYLKEGAVEGRNPSPDFDTKFYLETYPDVAQSGFNPLVHYIKFGRNEGRLPLPRGPEAPQHEA